MTHRDLQTVAEKLKSFMIQSQACAQAAKHLHKSVEIGIVIEKQVECAFFNSGSGTAFEIRRAEGPDVVFELSANAVDVLSGFTSSGIGELGIEVLKQYIAGEVHIRVPGNLFGIMKNGYLGIVKDAGLPFAKFIAENGVSNLTKIPEIIKRLKSR